MVSFTHAGTCTVTYSDPGNSDYLSASTSEDITVNKAQAVITITSTAPSAVTLNDGTTYTPSATSTSGDSVVIGVTGGDCTISGGVVSFTHAGTCTVTYSDPGNSDYLSASTSEDITVNKAQAVITITSTAPSAVTLNDGTTYTPSATSTSGDSVVIGVTGGDCTISGGVVSFTHAGTCTVTYSDPGNSDYLSASTSEDITVNKAQAVITITSTAPSAVTLNDGTTYTPSATSTSGDSVVIGVTGGDYTISGGVVSFTHAGTCTVTYSDPGNSDYLSASTSEDITVNKAQAVITITSTAPSAVTLNDGTTYTPSATSTSGDSVVIGVTGGDCTISGGVVSFTHAGTCTVTYSDPGNSDYLSASTSEDITVNKAQAVITITSTAPSAVTLNDGTTYTPSATSTSGDSVVIGVTGGDCTISGGVVSFTHAGTCTVTYSDPGNSDYLSASTSEDITVNKAQAVITITSTKRRAVTLNDGTTYTPSATSTSGDRWSSASRAGTARSRAASSPSPTPAPARSPTVTRATGLPERLDLGGHHGQQGPGRDHHHLDEAPGVTLNDGTTYTPSATSSRVTGGHRRHGGDCTISGGVVSFTHAGTCTVTYSDPGNSDYLSASTSEDITVNKAQAVITITSTKRRASP